MLAIDSLLNTNIRDIPIIILICIAVPTFLCHKIIKNENRFLSSQEQKSMVRKATLIAWLISSFSNIFYIGYCIFIKIVVPENGIPSMLSDTQLTPDTTVANFLTLVTVMIVYYLMIWLLITLSFKKASKYYKKLQIGAAMKSD